MQRVNCFKKLKAVKVAKSRQNLFAVLFDQYLTPGGKWKSWGNILESNARTMLCKTKIHKQLDEAKTLYKLERHFSKNVNQSHFSDDDFFNVARLAFSCEDHLVDPILLLSAYEMYFKSVMLRNRFVIHQIKKPETLKRKQYKTPIHVNEIRKLNKNGEHIEFSDYTIGIEQILSPSYQSICPIPSNAKIGLEIVRYNRNLVHCFFAKASSLKQEFLDLVEYLDKAIRPHDVLNKKRK